MTGSLSLSLALFLSLVLPLCHSLSLFVCLSQSFCLPIYISVTLTDTLSVTVSHCLHHSWSATRTTSFFPFIRLPTCLSLRLYVSLFVSAYLPLSVLVWHIILSVCPRSLLSISRSTSVSLSVHLSACLSTLLSFDLSVCQSPCLPLCVSIRLFLPYLSVSPTTV